MGSMWCLISLLTNSEWTSFIILWMFIIFAMYCTHISIPSNLFFSLSISILTLEKYTTKIYKTLIKCWYSWFQHSQSQWPYMESKQQLVITMSKACIHCELCFIVWHANIVSVSFTLCPKYKESQPKSSVSFTQKNKVQSCLISCKLLVIPQVLLQLLRMVRRMYKMQQRHESKEKKSKQVWMMVYSMANFNFTRGLEMPYWVQCEVPHMESGLLQICWAFNSFHPNKVASPCLHANIAFTNQIYSII